METECYRGSCFSQGVELGRSRWSLLLQWAEALCVGEIRAVARSMATSGRCPLASAVSCSGGAEQSRWDTLGTNTPLHSY